MDLGGFLQFDIDVTLIGIRLDRQRFAGFDVMLQARFQIPVKGDTA